MAQAPRKYERFHVMRKARVQNRMRNFVIMTAIVAGCLLLARNFFDTVEPESFVGRHLLSGGGCAEKEDGSLDYASWIKDGGVAVYFIGVIYLFLGIAIVCDDFFIGSLEAISEKLKLSEDVAGATFMAAGSSAPELFSSVVSLANPSASSEIGVGTIVGSAVFNVLAIIGVTAIFAGRTLDLDWKPVTRDAIFYAMAISSIIIIFQDGMIKWYEGMVAVFAYCIYVLFMVFNERIMNWIDSKTARNKVEPLSSQDDAESGVAAKAGMDDTDDGTGIPAVAGEGEEEEEEEEDNNPFAPPGAAKDYPLWLLSLPWYAAFTITIPDCTKPKWGKWYLVSFAMSIAWIAGISWLMVQWCVDIGCVLKIPPSVMGVTVLAAGTSIPDALSSIVVAKQGQGNMAVANAIGSNVFDIWLGLGLPWWIFLLADKIQDGKPGLCVSTTELRPNVIILFAVLIFYYGLLVVFKFKLYVKMGIAFVGLYIVFALWQILGVWWFDLYGLGVPDIQECLCHLERDRYVTKSCHEAANGVAKGQEGSKAYDTWWENNSNDPKYSDANLYDPSKWLTE